MQASSPELVVVLGPIGVGKTTRVNRLRSKTKSIHHLSVDRLIHSTAHKMNTDLRSAGVEVTARVVQTAQTQYTQTLDAALASKAEVVVVDYVSGGTGEWLLDTIKRAHRAGRKVTMEGVYAEPDQTLPRTLTRDTSGIEPDRVHAAISDPVKFQGWLRTYRDFPRQFTNAVQKADAGRLLDNNELLATDARLVAEWPTGSATRPPILHNPQAYDRFLKLDAIDPRTHTYQVKIAYSDFQGDDWMHTFSVRRNLPTAPRGPAPRPAAALKCE